MPYSVWAVARVAPTVAPPVAVGLVCVAPAVVAVAVAPVVPAAVATPLSTPCIPHNVVVAVSAAIAVSASAVSIV